MEDSALKGTRGRPSTLTLVRTVGVSSSDTVGFDSKSSGFGSFFKNGPEILPPSPLNMTWGLGSKKSQCSELPQRRIDPILLPGVFIPPPPPCPRRCARFGRRTTSPRPPSTLGTPGVIGSVVQQQLALSSVRQVSKIAFILLFFQPGPTSALEYIRLITAG